MARLPQNDRTALHYAVAGKNKEAVHFLLQRRIKVDQKDRVRVFKKTQKQPLHIFKYHLKFLLIST